MNQVNSTLTPLTSLATLAPPSEWGHCEETVLIYYDRPLVYLQKDPSTNQHWFFLLSDEITKDQGQIESVWLLAALSQEQAQSVLNQHENPLIKDLFEQALGTFLARESYDGKGRPVQWRYEACLYQTLDEDLKPTDDARVK